LTGTATLLANTTNARASIASITGTTNETERAAHPSAIDWGCGIGGGASIVRRLRRVGATISVYRLRGVDGRKGGRIVSCVLSARVGVRVIATTTR
jgi:hypothetical protein